jgi:MFS family permease
MMPGAGPRPSLRAAFSAFGNRHFRWLWTSTLTSFIGMQMQMVALGILAWDLTGSYTLVGVVQAAFALPMAVLSLPGGAAVDRVEKRRIVAISQGAMGLLALSTAVLAQTDLITVVILFLTGMGQGALFSFNGPARMAMLTETVETRELTAAISLQNLAMNGTRIVAPAVAGVVIAVVSVAGAYYVAAAMFIFTVFAVLRLPPTTSHIGRARLPLPREIGEGLRYVFGNHTLRSLMLSGFALVFFVMPYNVLLPGFADSLGREAYFGLMVAVAGAGGLLGSLGIATLTDHPRKPLLQLFIGLTTAAALVLLGVLSRPFGIGGALVALAILGATSTSYMTLNQTMLMTESAPEFHGRVMSIFMQTFSAMPLMALPLGLVADVIGPSALFVLQGGIVAAVLLLFAFGNRAHTFRVGDPNGSAEAASESASMRD